MYCLEITYKGFFEWPSPERFDERVEKLLKKASNGSGAGFGGRDFTFSYRSLADARKAAAKVRAYAKKEKRAAYRKARVNIFKYED